MVSDYTPNEVAIMIANAKLPYKQIAKIIGRTTGSVDSKMYRLGFRHSKHSFPKGEKHPRWKGGRITHARGYIQVMTGPGAYSLEHRLVWEKANGRKLPSGWIVHHLNGVKTDNRPENLSAMPRSKHSVWTLVELAQKRIRDLEEQLSK